MAHVRKVEDAPADAKQWECRWSAFETGGKRKFYKQRFRTKAEAEAKRREVEDKQARGLDIDPNAGKETVQAWAERWHADYARTVKPSTGRKSRGLLDSTVIPRLGHLRVRDVRMSTVSEWLAWIEDHRTSRDGKGKISPATIKHHYLVLSNVLRYAAEHGAIAANPAVGVRLPTNRTRGRLPREPRFLTSLEVAKLADALPYPYGLLVQFMAFTGLRVGEIAGLNVVDIDLVNRRVHVARTRTKRACLAKQPDHPDTCDGAECCWEVHTPKSGKARTTPIPKGLAEDLVAYLRQHPNANDQTAPLWPGRTITGRSRSGNLSSLDYDKPWCRSSFYKRQFQPALKAAGLPTDVRLHDLRHSFASICASSGVPAAQVAEWMGHGNEIVTRTTYTHLFKEDTSRHEEALSAAFTTGTAPGTHEGRGSVTVLRPA